MCATADRLAEKEIHRATRDLATLLALTVRTRQYHDIPPRTMHALEVICTTLEEAAGLANAAAYLRQRVLDPQVAIVLDIPITSDLRSLQRKIHGLFDSRAAPRRGFVYLAWRVRPPRYVYAGKAGSVARLNLAQNGKLARATSNQHATRLTLIFPTQSRREILLGVEASLMRVIEASTGSLPELNDQRGTVPPGPGLDELDFLGGFLQEVSDRVVAG